MANSGSKYQVFLNFCGMDTRRGFTNTLYHALVDAGIRVFIDNEEIGRGEEFRTELLQAIDDSKLYIIIFSPNYASKHWCLKELAKMVENAFGPKEDGNKKVENTSNPEEDGNKKVILPIFYNVKPDDVNLKTDLYSKSISELEQKMEDQEKKFSTDEVETWRRALRKVDAIQGWELEKYQGDGDLSKLVANEVVSRLQTRQREVTEDLVGMEDRIAAINNLLDINSGGVRVIGIYGMGGVGKTTLAKVVFNQLCPHFGKNCSFLHDVSETVKTKGLVKLQEKLLSDISNTRAVCNIGSIDDGISTIRRTICNKKVLIVLDDVDKGNQIQELIGVHSLDPGTRILVTTRDRRVLKIRGFKYEIVPYELEGLNDKDALQLFSRHAFDDDSPLPDYYTLSKGIVSTVRGLPLALQAIGSSLFFRKEKKVWEDMLEKLRKTPHRDVLGKLRISYDALEMDQQQIFLDVACFFIGQNKANSIYVWKDCGFSPEYAIDILINRCMIKIIDDNMFWMHDQFRDLGRTIANQERSRLWATDDIICELTSTEIKGSVQAICLLAEIWTRPFITVTSEQLKRFPNLRFLWLSDVTCQGDFTGCLSKLKWINLHYPTIHPFLQREHHPRFEATNLRLQNVVVVNLFGVGFTEDEVSLLIKGATKLKVLTLRKVGSICRTPTFSENSSLEKLTISECHFLHEIDCSIGKLRWLTDLSIRSCWELEKLPEQIGELKNLQHLSVMACKLRELPESVLQLASLTKLDVSHTCIQRLPDSINRLPRLSSLNVSSTYISKVPGTMSNFRDLQKLMLYNCSVMELPELPRSLTTLQLSSTSLWTIPNLSELTNLVELFLSDGSENRGTSRIIHTCDLQGIGKLSKLNKLELCLSNVCAPPTELGSLFLLKELALHGLDLKTLRQFPPNLTALRLYHAPVKQVPLDWIPQLEELVVEGCDLLEKLSITSSLTKLRVAEVTSCTDLVEVRFLSVLKSMERFCLADCKSLESLVCLSEEPQAPESTYGGRRLSLIACSLKMLQELHLSSCPKLHEIQFVSALESLENFSVERCISLERLGGLSNLKKLKYLRIAWCKRLQVVEGIDELKFLLRLEVEMCESIESHFYSSTSKLPNECQITITGIGDLRHAGLNGSSIICESYREKSPLTLMNAHTSWSED